MTDSIQFANRSRQLVSERWREYLPALTILARQHAYPEEKLRAWQNTFHRRLRVLIDAGVRWPAIRAQRLDDPVVQEETFEKAMKLFWERSARRGPRTGSHEHYRKDFEKRYAKEQAT